MLCMYSNAPAASLKTPRSARAALPDTCDIPSAANKRKVEVVGTPELSDKDCVKMLATLTKKATAAIKRTAHNDKKKPYTILRFPKALPAINRVFIVALLDSFSATRRRCIGEFCL